MSDLEVRDAAGSELVRRAMQLADAAHRESRTAHDAHLERLALTANVARRISCEPSAEAAAWLHNVLLEHPEYEERIRDEFPHLAARIATLRRLPGESESAFDDRVVATGDRLALFVELAELSAGLCVNPPSRPERRRVEARIDRVRAAIERLEPVRA